MKRAPSTSHIYLLISIPMFSDYPLVTKDQLFTGHLQPTSGAHPSLLYIGGLTSFNDSLSPWHHQFFLLLLPFPLADKSTIISLIFEKTNLFDFIFHTSYCFNSLLSLIEQKSRWCYQYLSLISFLPFSLEPSAIKLLLLPLHQLLTVFPHLV